MLDHDLLNIFGVLTTEDEEQAWETVETWSAKGIEAVTKALWCILERLPNPLAA